MSFWRSEIEVFEQTRPNKLRRKSSSKYSPCLCTYDRSCRFRNSGLTRCFDDTFFGCRSDATEQNYKHKRTIISIIAALATIIVLSQSTIVQQLPERKQASWKRNKRSGKSWVQHTQHTHPDPDARRFSEKMGTSQNWALETCWSDSDDSDVTCERIRSAESAACWQHKIKN